MLIFWLLSAVYAEEPDASIMVEENRPNYQVVQIYVDITEVHTPDGKIGTSMPLNIMMAEEAQKTTILENRMHRHTGAEVWNGEINVYDWKNVQYMPTYKKCNYNNAVKCGIQNGHWTLRTIISVGDKYSIFTVYLYDETGHVIASSDQTAWGTIRWKPRWKLTRIKEQNAFGGGTTEIFERWPDKMEEIPPLITPKTISQASFGFYWVKKKACRTRACRN
tara:strand:- start:462 stop:1124 length:663 start_codon:yes stop_codon:yes gene_type:complete